MTTQSTKPTEPGTWLVRCMEGDYEWEPVLIEQGQRGSFRGLIVHCPHIGPTPLDYYHDGLTDIEWQRPH